MEFTAGPTQRFVHAIDHRTWGRRSWASHKFNGTLEFVTGHPEELRTSAAEAGASTCNCMTNTHAEINVVPAARVSRASIHLGTAQDVLSRLPEESVHAVIPDPPYGLAASTDVQQMLEDWSAGRTYFNEAPGYAGAEWDHAVPGPELWTQVHRLLAPGGFVVAFGATRTIHHTAMALEVAGFEIRDLVHWTYPPGRPTSGDLGKLDAELGGRRATLRPSHEPITVARKPLEEELTLAENVVDFGTGAINHDVLTGEPGAIATNRLASHDIACTREACACGMSDLPDRQGLTHLYPSDSIDAPGQLHHLNPGRAERPIGPDGTTHLTVKPLSLMRTLVRAFSLEGQTVLDPFLGSGTTAEAALLEGRHIVGCEMAPEFLPLIAQRIARAAKSRSGSA